MTARRSAAVYAIGHFLVDFSCALLLLTYHPPAWMFLLYNFCAFAVQMPIGILADIIGKNRSFSLIGIMMVAAAFIPLPMPLRVLLCGIGNACYHVGGGRESLVTDAKMTSLGIFVAPGAVGIFLGTVVAGNTFALILAPVFMLLCGAAVIWVCDGHITRKAPSKPRLSIAGVMLLVVILRSLVGLCMEAPWKAGFFIPLAAILGAAGKAAGGFLADRFGGNPVGVVTLLLAAGLYCLPDWGMAGVTGIFLFNMTMPITLRRASDALAGLEGFSFGLLTFGLFLGYLPSYFGITFSPWLGAALSVGSALLMLLDKESRHG